MRLRDWGRRGLERARDGWGERVERVEEAGGKEVEVLLCCFEVCEDVGVLLRTLGTGRREMVSARVPICIRRDGESSEA